MKSDPSEVMNDLSTEVFDLKWVKRRVYDRLKDQFMSATKKINDLENQVKNLQHKLGFIEETQRLLEPTPTKLEMRNLELQNAQLEKEIAELIRKLPHPNCDTGKEPPQWGGTSDES